MPDGRNGGQGMTACVGPVRWSNDDYCSRSFRWANFVISRGEALLRTRMVPPRSSERIVMRARSCSHDLWRTRLEGDRRRDWVPGTTDVWRGK